MEKFKTHVHEVDFCVIGGGMAGLCAAVAAARGGAKVALVNDRPVLGGNASSEIRMWISGAQGSNNRETGILEEIMLENQYRNPYKNYSIWDSILFEKARYEKNITLLQNCTCQDGEMEGDRLKYVKCWQLTTQAYHKIEAKIFADCSGDSILANITGALYRMGREAADEYGEDIEPPVADNKTMGMSCLIQSRETDSPKTYIPPTWAEKYTRDELLPHRVPDITQSGENFWYLELGGCGNTIDDSETLRDELLGVAFGMWDFVKNAPEMKDTSANYMLDWVGFLPGKRESRRYIGDYVMTQNDVRSRGQFEDIVAYGGWTMDDHNPEGFRSKGSPNIFHPAPSPYGIPYRTMYSKNVSNLMFAGRNISFTHAAMSSSRVMGTCAVVGEAVGTAAAIAVRNNAMPRDVYAAHLSELKQTLMDNDCYLPFNKREVSDITREAELVSDRPDAERLRNGYDRTIGSEDNGWYGGIDSYITYRLSQPTHVKQVRLVFDSDLNRATLPKRERDLRRPMFSNYHLDDEPSYVPKTLVRDFVITYKTEAGVVTVPVNGNHQRLVFVEINAAVTEITFTPKATHGAESAHVYAFDIK